MELHEYRKDFIETVRSFAAAEGEFEESAFVRLSAERLTDAEELDEFEPCYYEGTGRKNRKLLIHGYSFDVIDGSVNLIIAIYHGKEESETLTQTELSRSFDRLRAFTEEAVMGVLHPRVDESSPCFGLAYELYKRRDEIRRFNLYLVTDSILSNRVKELAEDHIIGIKIKYSVWDISRFHRIFESHIGKDELFVDFSQYSYDVLSLEAGQKQGEYMAYLCVIPGEVVAQIYDRFGSRLLEGNVRSFLSTKGKVNKGIRNTIINEPEMFFAYNNGISATATEAEFRKTERGLQLISATNLQIVNGGQTTASLLMTKIKDKQDLSKVFVQMKLSVVTPEISDNVVPMIARYANSQNQISEADFFSNHPFHIRMEGFSRRIWAPSGEPGAQHEIHWFYERTKGQYLNEQSKMTPSEQRKFQYQNPRNKVITKTDLGKYIFSWMCYPHLVSLGPQKNFKHFAQWISNKWEESELEFNEDFFKNSVAYAILYKKTEAIVADQPWYQGSYRPNFVTYTMALLSHVISTRYSDMTLDLKAIWSRPALSNKLISQLVVLAEAAHKVIIKPELGIQIVQEWCKKELCWERVKQVQVEIIEGFEEVLVSTFEIKKAAKHSKAQQKVDNGIDAQVKVVGLGSEYWDRLRLFAQKKELVTREEDKLLNIAGRMSSGMMPSDKQSFRLLEISERLVSEGFTG